MVDLTNEDVLKSYQDKLGEKDGFIVHRLTGASFNLNLQWRTFLYFFCGPIERVELLNRTSGLTAGMFQNLLWDHALLTVRRLTDAEEKSGNTNISLGHLRRIAASNGIANMGSQYGEMLKKCDHARRYADKYIAHIDYRSADKATGVNVTRKNTTDAIKAISDFVHGFHSNIFDSHLAMVPSTSVFDEQMLLLRLFQGDIYSEKMALERRERMMSGDWSELNKERGPDWIIDDNFRDNPF